MSWDRIQRLELELAQARATIVAAREANTSDRLTASDLLVRAARLTIERDAARRLAARLEAECAACSNRTHHTLDELGLDDAIARHPSGRRIEVKGL